MVDRGSSGNWSTLPTPSPPPRSELLAAIFLGIAFAAAIVLFPFDNLWRSPLQLAGVGACSLILALLTYFFQRIRGITSPALVLIAWQVVMAIDQDQLPESFRGLGPQQIGDISSGVKLLLLRVGILALPVIVTLILCMSLPDSRERFREYFVRGDWSRGIRWPLPWWGVPPMPIWFFFLIGVPCAIPAFILVIDWPASQTRWESIAASALLLIPVLAFANAFMEEFVFRIGMLPLLSNSLSIEAATIPAAIMFGFVHFHGGYPNGLFGAMLLSIGGFFLGYFLLAQKGVSAAVLWHMLMDVIILSFVFK